MGLAIKSGLAVTALFGLVYALVFAIGIYMELTWWAMVLITLGIVFLQYLISPLIVRWIYRIDWIPDEELQKYFPHIADIVDRVVEMRGIKRPKVGIIHDLNPNAFTFGWTKNSARIVFTEGISEYCDKKEQQAVIAHECGHIVHNDFILMTVVFAIPLVMLTIARWAYWTARFSSIGRKNSDSDESQYIMILLYVIAALSYVVYYIGYLISLFISRIREYYADEFSAEVLENPNVLSSALVKIAYGLLINLDNEERAKSRVRGVKGLGIFDSSAARSFSQTSMGAEKKYSKEAIQAAAAWDLYNPWAKYFQLFSTHPLPAKRIMALNEQCANYNLEAQIDLSKAKEIKKKQAGKSMLDEFFVDLTIKSLPSILFSLLVIFTVLYVVGIVFVELDITSLLTSLAIIDIYQMLFIWGIGFFIIGIGHIIKTQFMYKSNYQPETVLDLVTNIKVSPIRCVPAVLDGYIVGRGVPGYYFSEDLFLQDKTGIMYIDYRSGFSLVDFIFSLWGAKKLQDHHVKVQGWYRRGPSPYLQVDRIIDVQSGKVRKNYAKALTYIWAVVSFLIGALLVYLSISALSVI